MACALAVRQVPDDAQRDRAEDEEKAAVVGDLIDFINNTENQVAMAEALSRIPGNAEAIADPVVADDPLLAGIGCCRLPTAPASPSTWR